MPWVNFCKKCKREVPGGEQCPYCYGKLTRTGERLSFAVIRKPVLDWFSWNQVLRVALPALFLVAVTTLCLEGMLSGGKAVKALFLQGFFWVLVSVLGVMLLGLLCLLSIQGPEVVRFVLDKDGVHAYTYLQDPTSAEIYARFLSKEAVEKMQREELQMDGYCLVRQADVLWRDVKRVHFWKETHRILFFNPGWWQALAVLCPTADYEEAEVFLRKKLGRNKEVKIIPPKQIKRE